MAEVRMRVWRVGRRPDSHYLLILKDDEDRPLVMVIGPCEALAIWAGLQERADEESRPRTRRRSRLTTTHDLIEAMLTRLGARIEKVVVDDLWNGTYYAKLHLTVDGEHLTIDGRPSDCVALALRAGAPVYVTEEVLAASREPEGTDQADQGGADPEAGLQDF